MRAEGHRCHPGRWRAGRMAGRVVAVLLPLIALAGVAAAAEPTVGVRAGDHRDYGRLVFDFPIVVPYQVVRNGAVVVFSFTETAPIGEPERLPRNVVAFTAKPGEAEVTLAPGVETRDFRVGNRIVLDVLNPGGATAAASEVDPPAVATIPADLALAAAHLPMPPPSIPLPLPPSPEVQGNKAPTGAPALEPGVKPAMAKPAAASPGTTSPGTTSPGTTSAGAAKPPGVALASRAEGAHAQPTTAVPLETTSVATPAAAVPAAPPAPVVPAAAQAGPPIPATELGPLAIAAHRVAAPEGAEAALIIPFGPATGAAAFRRGDDGVVVFDAARPIDMSALAGDPAFGAARVSMLPAATLLRVPLPSSLRLQLWHRDDGWVVGITAAPPAERAIVSTVAAGQLRLSLATAARVVLVPDPMSGTNLIVGTAHVPGAGIAATRRMPNFVLLRTWLGVAVVPLTDRLALNTALGGFTLEAGGKGGLPLSSQPRELALLEGAATLTRRFDFHAFPLTVMARRLHQQLDAVVAAPPLRRFAARLDEAKTLIALGMGPEAASLIELARIEDPRGANDADTKGLAAIAALLSGRLGQSSGLDDPRLSGSDEISLWRAARAALLHQDPAGTAPVFAATAGLILAYPEPLRQFLAPIAAEAMIKGGEMGPAGQLLAKLPATPALDFDRALLFATHGKTRAVLAAWERLSHSLDRRVAARAASRLVLLRLATGAIGPKAAADLLARQFYDWRGGRHELGLRLKVAALRAKAGQWGQALALLGRTGQLFPAEAASIRTARAATFRALLTGQTADKVAPLELVSLIEDNTDLIPPGRIGEQFGELLADRLVALDLPDRAEPVLAKLMAAAPAGPPRAAIGAKLALVRLAGNDPHGALAALSDSRAADLPHQLAVRRTLAYARALDADGQAAKAVSALAQLDDPEAQALAADIMQKAGNWAGAEAALVDLVARTTPASGRLTKANRTMLVRLASTAAQAGDAEELAGLRRDYGQRMGEDSLGNMFRLLTDPPASGVGDLAEVSRETVIAGQLPNELKAIG
ncbi:MAG: hypothetical protein ACREFU_01740, partial [Acetobacteraceae bacterium]